MTVLVDNVDPCIRNSLYDNKREAKFAILKYNLSISGNARGNGKTMKKEQSNSICDRDALNLVTSTSFLHLLLSIGRDGPLRSFLYDKRDDYSSHITYFLFLSSIIPSSLACGVLCSQLIRDISACCSFEYFVLSVMRLSYRLLGHGYVKERLKSSLYSEEVLLSIRGSYQSVCSLPFLNKT